VIALATSAVARMPMSGDYGGVLSTLAGDLIDD